MSIYMLSYYKNIAFYNEQNEQSHAYSCVTYCKKYFCSWTRNFSELFVYLDKWNQTKEIWEANLLFLYFFLMESCVSRFKSRDGYYYYLSTEIKRVLWSELMGKKYIE